MLANGMIDQLMYEQGIIDRSLSFGEMKRVSHINKRAQTAGDAVDFSKRIREDLQGM